MSKENKNQPIPSSENIISLDDIAPLMDNEIETSNVHEDFEKALKGEVDDDLLQLKPKEEVEEVIDPIEPKEEVEKVIDPITEPKPQVSGNVLETLKLILGEEINTIVQVNENGEEIETPLEELDLTPELVAEIISSKYAEDIENLKKDSISTKGVSELGKTLIDIDRRGGNITELLKLKQTISDPLEQLDLTTQEGQVQALTIRMQAAGHSPEDIEALLEVYNTKGILEQKAEAAAGELKQYYADQVEKTRKATLDAEEQRKKLLKDYTNDLKGELENSFQLKKPIYDKLIKSATRKTEKGTYEIDEEYHRWRNDPKLTAKLTLFMMNNEEYNNQISSQKVLDKQLESANRLGILKLKHTPVSGLETTRKTPSNNSGIVDINDL